MKKWMTLILAAGICLSICSCAKDKTTAPDNADASDNAENTVTVSSSAEEDEDGQEENQEEEEKEANDLSESAKEDVKQEAPVPTQTLGAAEFETLLLQMPVFVESTKYVVQDEQYKSLYPDALQAVIRNNTAADIKNAVLAYVAWDKNNLPVKLKGSIDFSDGSYISEVNCNDINLIPGATYGESSGYTIDEDCGVASFKAVVVSFETFDGDSWENPYYEDWRKLYEGVKYKEDLSVEVAEKDGSFTPKAASDDASGSAAPKTSLTEEELLAQIETQPLHVISTKYVVQDANYKSLYPDALQAVIRNDTTADIKNAVLAYVAWDKNNLPVKLKGSIDFSDGAYITEVKCNDINLIPGATYGESSGYTIDEDCGVATFKVIVVSYETFEGETWENPLYKDWRTMYEGVKLQ